MKLKSIEVGGNGYISKPINKKQLIDHNKQMLSQDINSN
jgi:PleD family two-component response regulator